MVFAIETVVALLADVLTSAVPIAILIALTNIIVRVFLQAAFGGKMEF